MLKRHSAFALVFLVLFALPSAAAPKPKGVMHYGDTTFVPVDMLAYQADGDQPGTVVLLTDFKIDRDALMKAIQPEDAILAQLNTIERSNFVRLSFINDACSIAGFFNQGMKQIGISGELTLKTSDGSHVSGRCYTKEPQKLFDDSYDVDLPFDLAVTAFPKPTVLPADGGEPGKALVAVIKAIAANDWKNAQPHLREREASQAPAASEMKDFFDSLKLNYPQTLSATGGLVKGNLARIDMKGTDYEGKKLEGTFTMEKVGGNWRVVEQYLHYAE